MFPAMYHRWTATVDVQLATSRDGLLWSRPERKLGELGLTLRH